VAFLFRNIWTKGPIYLCSWLHEQVLPVLTY